MPLQTGVLMLLLRLQPIKLHSFAYIITCSNSENHGFLHYFIASFLSFIQSTLDLFIFPLIKLHPCSNSLPPQRNALCPHQNLLISFHIVALGTISNLKNI